MAKIVMRDARVIIGGYDRSGDHNTVEVTPSRELLNSTTFASPGGWQEFDSGLRTINARGAGFWKAGAEAGNVPKEIDTQLFPAFDLDETHIISILAKWLAGEPVYSFKSIFGAYTPGPGQHGQQAKFSFEARGRGDVLAGGVALSAGNIVASGNSAAFNVGAVPAGKKLYAVLHTFAFAGAAPTLDVKVQSDDAQGFPSPTDRIVFAQKNGFAAEWANPVAGAITDNWWRLNFVLGGGGGPSFGVLGAIAIQ